jgi:small conductance mechanosensitive channel
MNGKLMEETSKETLAMIQQIWQTAQQSLTEYGLDVVAAIVILIVGVWIAGRVEAVIKKALGRAKRVDAMLVSFFASAGRYLVLIFVGVAVLGRFGIETTSLIAVLGAAGLAIGLALQGTLSNVAAGVMLLIFRPFKVGDFIEGGGHAGTVKTLNLFFTELATPDNIQIVVPNSDVWGTSIRNFSTHAERRVDFLIGVSYDTDLDQAMAALNDVIAAEPRIKSDPEPMVAVSELGDSSVNFVVRVWTQNADYFPVRFDMTKAIKEKLDAEKIDIPFPTQTLHVVKD